MKYCWKCGHKLEYEDIKYCHNCGQDLAEGIGIQNKKDIAKDSGDKILQILKPKFIFIHQLISAMFGIGAFFSTFFFGMMFMGISGNYLRENPVNEKLTVIYLPTWITGSFVIYVSAFIVALIIVYLIRPILVLLYYKLTYSKTEYRIKSNELEYREGFMTENYSTINFEKVIEVHLKKGIIQKQFNLGTVFLETPGSGKGRNGISINNISNYQESYELLKGLVAKANDHK